MFVRNSLVAENLAISVVNRNTCLIRLILICSKSILSFLTTSAKSWSSNPSGVTVKLITVTLINELYFDSEFWQEMGVSHSASHEKLEFLIVLQLRIAHFEQILKASLKDIPLQNRIENGIQPLFYILNQKGKPQFNAVFQMVHELRIVQFCHLQVVTFLPFFYPQVRLWLRVDY